MSDEFGVIEEKRPTALDYLRGVLAERREASARFVVLRDTLARPDLTFKVRVPRDGIEFAEVVKRSQESDEDIPDGLRLQCAVIARYTVQVTVDGQDVTPGDGSAFAYPDLQEVLGVSSPVRAVRKLIDDDFAIQRLYEALTREAGIGVPGVDVQDADPTRGR